MIGVFSAIIVSVIFCLLIYKLFAELLGII